eukprot:GEMP01077081.1.p1 GENE.GEMP01077081.1~~GEMP01077081.1.p1  ORF type:complete len:140 (+),score=31.87 GEMP01077081.1:38-457(+)
MSKPTASSSPAADAMQLAEWAQQTISKRGVLTSHNADNFPEISELEFASMRRAPTVLPPKFPLDESCQPMQKLPEYHVLPYPDNRLVQIASERWAKEDAMNRKEKIQRELPAIAANATMFGDSDSEYGASEWGSPSHGQ